MTYQKNLSSSGSLMYFLEEKSEEISNDTPERKLMYFSDVIPADHIETKLMYFSKKRSRSEEISLAIPISTNSRNYLSLLSFIADVGTKKSITNMIALSKKMDITNLLITKIIAKGWIGMLV